MVKPARKENYKFQLGEALEYISKLNSSSVSFCANEYLMHHHFPSLLSVPTTLEARRGHVAWGVIYESPCQEKFFP